MKTIATAKRATKIDEVIQGMDCQTYVNVLLKEPVTKLTRTRNGYTFKMIVVSKTAANQLRTHLYQLQKFGDVNVIDSNFASVIDVYDIDKFDLKNFLALVNKIKARIRMN